MYRGLGPTVLGYLPTWAIYFAVYDGIKNHFGQQRMEEPPAARHLYPAAQVKGYQPLTREHPWTLHLFSAMAAGATSTLCTNPLWVIKTRFMVRPVVINGAYLSTKHATDSIARGAAVQAYPRCCDNYLSDRGMASVLQRTLSQSSGYNPCRRSISPLRIFKGLDE